MINPWIILAVVLAYIASVSGAYLKGKHDGDAQTTAIYENKLSAQKLDASAALREGIQSAREEEQKRATDLAAQEKKDRENEAASKKQSIDLRPVLASNGGRLCAPASTRSRSGSDSAASATASSPVNSSANATTPAWVLRPEAEEFLAEFAADADALSDAFTSCRADSMRIRQSLH